MKTFLFTTFWLAAVSCGMKSETNKMKGGSQKRIQKLIGKDKNGRIVKTYDGFIYRLFDSSGRQIEWYGNYKNEESNSNIHNFVGYSDSVIIAKEYILEDDNTKCKIINPLDCSVVKYYYINGQLVKRKGYVQDRDKNGKIVGHKLVSEDYSPLGNPFIHKLPSYLK